MISKDKIYDSLKLLPKLDHIGWEILTDRHTEKIIEWRNASENKQFFESQDIVTVETQRNFLKNYEMYDRIDLVLLFDNIPIGVFNIKNLNSFPEYGSLIGDSKYRNKGLGSLAKALIFKLWFDILNQKELYLRNRKNNHNVVISNQNKHYSVFDEDEQYITFRVDKDAYTKNKTLTL